MQKERLEERILIVGLDDSNHAGKRRGEIDVATFSFYPEDGLIENFGKRAHHDEVQRWLKDQTRDYRFTVLLDKRFKHINTNLHFVAPYLIADFLETYNKKIDKVKLYIDGGLRLSQRIDLKSSCSIFPNFEFEYFIKEQGIHNCPKTVYIADALANQLYQENFLDIAESKKRVFIK